MTKPTRNADSERYFDVFISYRHRDSDKVDELVRKINGFGYTAFKEMDFSEFRGEKQVVPSERVIALRGILSRTTSLILAYDRAEAGISADSTVGAWTPWELGFFDGNASQRIGVYLLGGEPADFDPETYFLGSEFLQVYPTLTDKNLKSFLDRFAIPERRADNVKSAFIWFENYFEELLANPLNIWLGVNEWFADHAARQWGAVGNTAMEAAFRALKNDLYGMRVTTSRKWSGLGTPAWPIPTAGISPWWIGSTTPTLLHDPGRYTGP